MPSDDLGTLTTGGCFTPESGHVRRNYGMSAMCQKRTWQGHRPIHNDGLSPVGCAPSVQLVSYANGISALVLEMLVLSYRHQRASGHHQGITYSAGHIVVRPNA